jgi:hypothetical protein
VSVVSEKDEKFRPLAEIEAELKRRMSAEAKSPALAMA